MSQIRYSSNKLHIQIKQLDCRYGNCTIIRLINFAQEQTSAYICFWLVIKMSLDLKVLNSSSVWWKWENIQYIFNCSSYYGRSCRSFTTKLASAGMYFPCI